MATYREIITSESGFIAGRQLQEAGNMSGALLHDNNHVVPYFANQAATVLALSGAPGSLQVVTNYVRWYLNNLNWPDNQGLHGTVYDYERTASGWKPVERPDPAHPENLIRHYDSADAYAATFLSLLRAYIHAGGDKELLAGFAHQVEIIAGLNIVLMDKSDNLTIAKPNYPVKYLMDNCEVYRGLGDAAWLFKHVFGNAEKATYFKTWAGSSRKGILTHLATEAEFYVHKYGDSRKPVDWTTWYPDVTSQLFPVIFGVIPATDLKARSVYERMTREFPSWSQFTENPYPRFPWAIVAYAAALMGDFERMDQFKQSAENVFINQGRPWGWHAAEAAWLMMACRHADFVRPGWGVSP